MFCNFWQRKSWREKYWSATIKKNILSKNILLSCICFGGFYLQTCIILFPNPKRKYRRRPVLCVFSCMLAEPLHWSMPCHAPSAPVFIMSSVVLILRFILFCLYRLDCHSSLVFGKDIMFSQDLRILGPLFCNFCSSIIPTSTFIF